MPTLGLCMIVKNGAGTLRRCLESAASVVDTMVIGDTGSTDQTVAIAREFGASILSVPWKNDFAAARNTVLAALNTDWVLTLDADEELPEQATQWIREAMTAPDIAAYLVQVRNYLSPHLPAPVDQVVLAPGERHPRAPNAVAYFPSACCRLFRRQPGIVYTGCVHEMVDYQLPGLGAGVQIAGFIIHHFGWYLADAECTAQKRTLYRQLLARKMEQMPDDPNTLVRYAALLAEDCAQPEEALVYARQAAEIDGQAAGAWLFTGMILRRLGRYEEALEALARVPAADQPAFRAQLQGDALYGLERFDEALLAYGEARALAPLDRLVASKLGLLEVRTGQWKTGMGRLRRAADAQPPLPEADEMLICACLAAGRFEDAAREAERIGFHYGSIDIWLRIARIYAQLPDWAAALRFLDLGIAQFPDAHELHSFRINAGVAIGALHEAARAAERVVELAPTPRSFLRLAAILSRSGNEGAAASILQRGAALFPRFNELTGTANVAAANDEAQVACC